MYLHVHARYDQQVTANLFKFFSVSSQDPTIPCIYISNLPQISNSFNLQCVYYLHFYSSYRYQLSCNICYFPISHSSSCLFCRSLTEPCPRSDMFIFYYGQLTSSDFLFGLDGMVGLEILK